MPIIMWRKSELLRLFDKKTSSEARIPLFPHLGQRIIKTTIAVYLCLLVCSLRGLIGQDMSAEAAITAIICMQPFVSDTKTFAFDRFTGTLIGSVWGLLFLVFLAVFPPVGANPLVLYSFMASGVLLSLYSSVLLRKPDTSSLSAIVFICIVVAYPNIDAPLMQAGNRFLDVFAGNTIAIIVNEFRLPREKDLRSVFFLKTRDLVPDKFSQLAPSVMYRLNDLFSRGAKICLMSEHAPAFFESQMSLANVNTPMIVMDGAAVYDMKDNKYLYMQTIPYTVISDLRKQLSAMGTGYFIYTVHNDRTCIFHQGRTSEQENQLFEILKRSPYRSYLEGEIYDPNEIVYLKVINTKETLTEFLTQIRASAPGLGNAVRPVIRKSTKAESVYELYLYSAASSMENAKAFVKRYMRRSSEGLTFHEESLEYHSERDALHLLHKVDSVFAPLKLPFPAKWRNVIAKAAGRYHGKIARFRRMAWH